MAAIQSHNRNTILALVAGALLVVLIALLVVSGGHNGQPSAASGPGNPMQTDLGR